MRTDIVDELKDLITEVELARLLRRCLNGVRLTHESSEQTLDRVLRLASTVICQKCHGYGHGMTGLPCRACKGTGEIKVGQTK